MTTTEEEMLDVARRMVEEDDKRREGNGNGVAAALGEWNAGLDIEPPPPRGWLLGNSFCRRFISSVLGDGGVGKSALRILQALSLATGRNLTGEHVFQRTRVLLVSFEDDAAELRRRVLAARLHYDIPLSELDGWLWLAAPGAAVGKLMTLNARTGALTVGDLPAHIKAVIQQREIGLVMLDPFIKTHGIPENANTEMDMVAQLLTDMAAKYDIAVDLPHHISKGTAEPGNPNRGRGASASNNAARLVYTLSPMSPEEAQRFNISEDERRDHVRLDRAKLNIARTSGPATWFRLVGVKLGNPTSLYPAGDEVQTVEPWAPPDTWAGLDNDLLNRILTAIDSGRGDGNYYTATNSATDRAAWEVVQRFAPEKNEAQARDIITAWLKSGLLEKFDYINPTTRRSVKGLKVNSIKRPG
jgi:AAA domain